MEQKFSSSVVVFEDLDACNAKLCEEIENYCHEIIVLGLDCEWVSQERQESPVSPVALLQLAFPKGTCFLIRLCKMRARLPDKLRDILEDRNVLKTGVGISEDTKKLNSCYGLVMQGCVDLRHVAVRCQGYVEHCISKSGTRYSYLIPAMHSGKIDMSPFQLRGMSLSALSQQIIGETMDKDWRIRCSNWEAPQLSERQIQYAANDAIVAAQVFFKLAASKLRERESRVEAGKTSQNEDIVQAVDVQLKSKGPQSSGKNYVDNEYIPTKHSENIVPSQTDPGKTVVASLKDTSSQCSVQNEIPTTDSHSISENIADKSESSDLTGNVSEEGILSSFVTKVKNSFGSVLGFQETPQEQNPRKHKTKIYFQYQSFKTLELNEKLLSSPEFWSSIAPLCHGIVDVPYKMKSKQKAGGKTQSNEKGKPGLSSQAANKVSALKPRRAPLYQNCVLEAPDGEMLSTCDKRKAEWYLSRDLAKVVKDDPYTIRLNFEPSGRPYDPENNYYLTFKENVCVVCGRDDSYMRKNVIPHDYRKHFPACMKDHHSHDVLLLCPPCHMISTYHDDLLRRKLAEKYQAPLASAQVARLVQDPELKKVKCAAKALVYAGKTIPEQRRNELLSTVKDYLKTDNPTREMLLQASELETRRENCDFVSHGREVVLKVKESGELLSFERMWRKHFLETMKPKYLPPLWTVDHEQEKVRRLLEKELAVVE